MNRRAFLKSLSALPLVGGLFAKDESKPEFRPNPAQKEIISKGRQQGMTPMINEEELWAKIDSRIADFREKPMIWYTSNPDGLIKVIQVTYGS